MLALALSLWASRPTVMATLPAGTVPGYSGDIRVLEDLLRPDAPIVFEAEGGAVILSKNRGEAQVPTDPAELWGGVGVDAVLAEQADLLGNRILAAGGDPDFGAIYRMVPPALPIDQSCADFELAVRASGARGAPRR